MSYTVRGIAKVTWKPNYTISISSPDGLAFDKGTTRHPLVVSLSRTADGTGVANRTILLTTSPTGRPGHGSLARTNTAGSARFSVYDTVDETVTYTANLIPSPTSSMPTISDSLTIVWGVGSLSIGSIGQGYNSGLGATSCDLFTFLSDASGTGVQGRTINFGSPVASPPLVYSASVYNAGSGSVVSGPTVALMPPYPFAPALCEPWNTGPLAVSRPSGSSPLVVYYPVSLVLTGDETAPIFTYTQANWP